MRNLTYKNILIVSALLFLFSGCKLLKTPEQLPSLPAVPEAYSKAKQEGNSAEIHWKTYFSDTTLTALIDTALNNNIDIRLAMQRIEMGRAQVEQAKGLTLPFVSGVGSVGQRRFGKYTMDGIGNYDTNFSNNITKDQNIPEYLPDFNIGLQSSWEIDIWGKLRTRKEAALARYLATVEGRNFVITNLIADIAFAYYELLAFENELDIIRENIALQDNELSIIRIQKDAGRANELAVNQFEAQLLNSKSFEVEIVQRIIETENRINLLSGRFPQPIRRNKARFTTPLPALVHVGIPAELLKNRPDVRQAEYELMATKAHVYIAKAAFYPSLNLTAALGLQSFNPEFLITPHSIAYNIVGGLTAPLFNKSALKAELKTARATQVEALYNYQKSILNGYFEVYNQMALINNLEKLHTLKTSEATVLNKSIQTASDLFSTGRASYLEVILNRKNALQSKIELIDVRKRQYYSLINIYRALGGGWK
ncbi:efflux transporter outer membrane subunit [Runella sp.]|uniref:efflux transporter outer membrane subunit n=1 Tax=Runella sp. TaxID=1960881 RepID=UPI003D0FAD65